MEPAPPLIARQIKVPEPLYTAVEKRAAAENQTVIGVVIDYITRYTHGAEHPRPAVKFASGASVSVPEAEVSRYLARTIPTRRLSFRIDREYWEDAHARALSEGTSLAAVVNRFLRGYAAHIIN